MALKKIQYDVRLLSTGKMLQANMPIVYTNDLNSAEFVFNILDMTSEQLTGATATTLIYMRDGSFFQNSDVNLNGNTFTYLLKENEGNHSGLAKIQLVVKIGTAEYASQLYSFGVVNGLETKVAVEVMIQDWTTLLREARAYIAQFLVDEEDRQATFVANEQDRQLAFEAVEALRQQKETERQEAEATRQQQFDDAQTARTNIFTQSETDRTTAFSEAEALRQVGYDADHGRAETDHTTAVADHTTAVADHTTAVADHTTAVADHAMVQGFDTRLTAEETATANNKISSVKGKTFADVDARFEELEAQSIAFDAKKADKVQEAWITPTLINGWKTFVNSPVQYRKDEFGIVHFRGRLDPSTKTAMEFCYLPAGYRPTAHTYINFAGSQYLVFTPTGSCQSAFNVWQSLEMVKFHTT